jgi:hypothetical protein
MAMLAVMDARHKMKDSGIDDETIERLMPLDM